jgi:UDP-N-acetylglucosamine 2-epimerase
LKQFGLWDMLTKKIKVIKPVGYLDMLMLEKNAKKILTDSGGIQKEAYIFNVPCITLRDNTEWVETVEDGWNVLVGADKDGIVKMANELEPEGRQRDVFA